MQRGLCFERRGIGVVFQSTSLDVHLTVRENLVHQGHLYGLRGGDLSERVDRELARIGMADRARDREGSLSGVSAEDEIDGFIDPTSLPAYQAVAEYLMERR